MARNVEGAPPGARGARVASGYRARMVRVRWLIAWVAVVGAGVSRDARACSLPGPEPFVIDGTPTGAAPQPPRDLAYTVTRGKGPKGGAASTCDDLGIVKITLTPPAGDVGFVVEQIAGTLPDGVALTPTPVRLAGLQIIWTDGATDAQERLDFTIRLASIDRAGQQSAWSAPLRITDSGGGASAPASCALAGWGEPGVAPSGLALAGTSLAVVALARRRRRALPSSSQQAPRR